MFSACVLFEKYQKIMKIMGLSHEICPVFDRILAYLAHFIDYVYQGPV
jgi:hypothetical protein